MRFIKILFFFIVFQISAQQGGMWIPSLLEGMNEKEMQNLGSKLTAKDIYDVNNSSLKDAIGHFNGGCTPAAPPAQWPAPPNPRPPPSRQSGRRPPEALPQSARPQNRRA